MWNHHTLWFIKSIKWGHIMKLRLTKSQRSSGVVSKKVVFSLGAQVDLTAQESDYVKTYKMGKEVIYNKDRVNPDLVNYNTGKGIVRNLSAALMNINLTVDDLVKGKTIECKDITEMLHAEASVKTACKGLKGLLDACAGFAGEEVIDY